MANDVPYRKLRILLVDDNRINLSVLSTLLKRRFGDLLDGPPISVDSGLKAIQLLRTNVFDCILMDIQMPFLSGLDASIRIRNGEDGVLEANRDAHIVAVTTAVGDEPELAYRRAGMDGMIGKPVRFQDMQHYICPLAHEAFNAALSVDTICIEGENVMPPLPPTLSRSKRIFYLPANATIRAPQPDICTGADFEKMLRAQTRASLRKGGAIAIARTSTWSASHTANGRRQEKSKENAIDSSPIKNTNDISQRSPILSIESESESASEPQDSNRGRSPKHTHVRPKHSRNASLTIDKRTLSQQIQREIENMEGQISDLSDSGMTKARPKIQIRPSAVHRTSSPAWLVTQEPCKTGILPEAAIVSPTSPVMLSPNQIHTSPSRPKWLLSMKSRANHNDSRISSLSSSGSSSGRLSSLTTSDNDEYIPPPMTSDATPWVTRRDSQRSNNSFVSDVSTDVPTPANDIPEWASPSLTSPLDSTNFRHIHRLSTSSSSTIDPWSSDDSEPNSNTVTLLPNGVRNGFAGKDSSHSGTSQSAGDDICQDDCLARDVQSLNLRIN